MTRYEYDIRGNMLKSVRISKGHIVEKEQCVPFLFRPLVKLVVVLKKGIIK